MLYIRSRPLQLLLQWADLVGRRQAGLPAANFTTAFSDGRLFCHLVAFYAPHVLSVTDIRNPPAVHDPLALLGIDAAAAASDDLNSVIAAINRARPADPHAAAKANYKLLVRAMQLLGGIPHIGLRGDVGDGEREEGIFQRDGPSLHFASERPNPVCGYYKCLVPFWLVRNQV